MKFKDLISLFRKKNVKFLELSDFDKNLNEYIQQNKINRFFNFISY
jgi:hypothetical protein